MDEMLQYNCILNLLWNMIIDHIVLLVFKYAV